MSPEPATSEVWLRRKLLTLLAAPLAVRCEIRRQYPPERVRYADPATEFEVQRLTDPAHACHLPPSYHRVFHRRGNFLIYAGDRDGSLQIFTLDLKSWESRQVTEAASLDRLSMTLTADDRFVCYVDSGAVWLASITGTPSPRRLCELSKDSLPGAGIAAVSDGSALVIDSRTRLNKVTFVRGSVSTVATASEPIFDPMPRPRRASVLYRTGDGSLWLAHMDGSRNVALKTAPGRTGPARWSPDGSVILYLNYPPDGRPHALRELAPDSGEDKFVASTTQFIQFSSNSDASVFVGASKSLASPYVLLLIRAARRELTLCEHRSSDPSMASPVMSPDSQRVFFQSDRHGKPAIYSMAVEKLIEKTENEAESK
jgi:oligogalacturonide lyase